MTNKIRGGAFRLTGLILGIVGATVSLTACTRRTCARPVKKEKNSNEIHQGGNPFQS